MMALSDAPPNDEIRLPPRWAQLLQAMQARAQVGEVRAMTAELANDIGLITRNASCVLRSLTEAGLVETIEVPSRSKPGRWRIVTDTVVAASRPRGPVPARVAARHVAVAPMLFDWITARIEKDGTIEMGTRTMADGVGIGVSTVETLLARWKAIGAVRVLRRGGPWAVTRWRFDIAQRDLAAACTAVHPSKTGSIRNEGASRGQANGAEPAMRAPGAIRTRCPFCEMPPGHALCSHGWDGATTRSQRRLIAENAGIFTSEARR